MKLKDFIAVANSPKYPLDVRAMCKGKHIDQYLEGACGWFLLKAPKEAMDAEITDIKVDAGRTIVIIDGANIEPTFGKYSGKAYWLEHGGLEGL